MIYAGTDLKYKVTAEDFSLKDNDFTITIKNRWGQVKYTITKEDCFYDDEDNYYFVIENVQNGEYYAFFQGSIEDEDYGKMTRSLTDSQLLCTVGGCGCDMKQCECDCSENLALKVHYEQVWTASIDDADYLCDKDGNYILTKDGKRITFKK